MCKTTLGPTLKIDTHIQDTYLNLYTGSCLVKCSQMLYNSTLLFCTLGNSIGNNRVFSIELTNRGTILLKHTVCNNCNLYTKLVGMSTQMVSQNHMYGKLFTPILVVPLMFGEILQVLPSLCSDSLQKCLNFVEYYTIYEGYLDYLVWCNTL